MVRRGSVLVAREGERESLGRQRKQFWMGRIAGFVGFFLAVQRDDGVAEVRKRLPKYKSLSTATFLVLL